MVDTIIIGAGVSGLMAGQILKEKNILILEKMPSAGKKLLLTGGGRCNLTNLKSIPSFLQEVNYNNKFLYSTLHTFGPQEIYDFFNPIVPLKTEKEDQIFPISNRSKDILNVLLDGLDHKIHYDETVHHIQVMEDGYQIKTTRGHYNAKHIIIACGGASFSTTGSAGDHMYFAKSLGLDSVPLFPAETSILLSHPPKVVATSFQNAKVSFDKHIAHGNLIFTHKGLSGTSIMKLSETIYLKQIKEIFIDFNTQLEEETIRLAFQENREGKPSIILSSFFTRKFSDYLCAKAGIDETCRSKHLVHKQINLLIELIKNHRYEILGCEVLEKAYVTGGGISIKEVNPKTFETKKHKNLYIVGESLDIHGPIGGYNITLALSSGYSAANAILNQLD
ncbi:MAG: aminoacetone oxidase family FAD-binding enzyme [Erysipelotrichaceae bacterium]